MPDISKCANETCQSRRLCWRYCAPDTPGWQAYADFKPEENSDRCGNFWPMFESKLAKPKTPAGE